MSTIRNQAWSTSGLIAAVSRNAMLPAQQNTFTNNDIMEMLDEECSNTVVPFILGLDQNYFLNTVLIPVIQTQSWALSTGFAGTQGSNVAYQLPPDAVGKKLKNVSILNNNGNPLTLPEVTPWQVGARSPITYGFWVEGDQLFLFPAQQFQSNPYIQIVYPAAPLSLCDDSGTAGANAANAAQVSAADLTTGTVTVTPLLPGSFTVGADVNFIRPDPAFATSGGATILGVAGFTFTVDPTLLVTQYNQPLLAPGFWVANAGYSPFLQLPKEGRNLVTQATIAKMLLALNDEGAKAATNKYEQLEKAALKLFSPRIDDSPKVLTSRGQGVGAWRRYRRQW